MGDFIHTHFGLRAVDGEQNSICGIVRMTEANSTSSEVRNICGIFMLHDESYLAKNALFFCGPQLELGRNYRRGIPTRLNLAEFKDKDCPPVEKSTYGYDDKLGQLIIPTYKMELSLAQKQIISFLFTYYVANLGEWLGEAKRETVPPNNSAELAAAFRNKFRSFPGKLRAAAIEKKYFYSLNTEASLLDETPLIQQVSPPPIELLLPWAREYIDRFQLPTSSTGTH